MTELAGIFFWSFAIGFTGAVMPGPLLVLTLKESADRGAMAPFWLSCGHSICELAVVLLFVVGLSAMIPVEAVVGPVGLVGGVVLGWMAYGAYRQSSVELDLSESATAVSRGRSLILGGGVVTVSNPYWTLWWLTVGMKLLVDAGPAGVAGVGAFYAGHILSDFAWFGFVGFVIGGNREMLKGKPYRYLMLACACLLAGFGIWFIFTGGRRILSNLA
jgi:threonine/homoserine/homoserine lactone efflux protein